MLDILERYCPLWSIGKRRKAKCFEECAWYEAWTNLDENGAEQDGVCLMFNLRFLNWLKDDDD